MRLLFNNEIEIINWRRPHEYIQYNLVLNELLKKKTINISPKFIVDFINANPTTRKSYSSKLGNAENFELNNFLSDNALTLTRLLKLEFSFYVVDSVVRTELISDYQAKKDHYFFQNIVRAAAPNIQNSTSKENKQKKSVNQPLSPQIQAATSSENSTLELLEFLPNNINNRQWSCNFTIWMSSILQFIKDVKLKDSNVSLKSINNYYFKRLGQAKLMVKNLSTRCRRKTLI